MPLSLLQLLGWLKITFSLRAFPPCVFSSCATPSHLSQPNDFGTVLELGTRFSFKVREMSVCEPGTDDHRVSDVPNYASPMPPTTARPCHGIPVSTLTSIAILVILGVVGFSQTAATSKEVRLAAYDSQA
ncbi:hypothetical protein BDZ45DRAFT_680151 [Acephala macrosclerotiorum]|nr:hypothetical protein BDZ45DRAFT_680151 [Acephala macrosclerotiorum]